MPSFDTPDLTPPAFVRALQRLGVGRLDRIADLPLLVWFSLLVIVVEAVGLQAYNVAVGRPVVFVENPLWLVRPLLLLGAAAATHSLHTRYARALDRSLLTDAAGSFRQLVPDRLSWAVIGLGVAFTLVNAVVVLTLPQLYDAGGLARVARFLVVTPFGYVPVLGTFLATYLSIQLLLPHRLRRSRVPLDYLDPEGLGGTRPIGELLKGSYYLLMVGLVGYALATYGPYVLSGPLNYEGLAPPGTAVNVIFTAVWAASVAAMVYGIFVVHRYMTAEKKRTIQELKAEAREAVGEPWDVRAVDLANPPAAYEHFEAAATRVAHTQEYPATFTMWTQLLVGVFIPKAIQLTLAAL